MSTLDQDQTLARRELESWVERQGGTVADCIEESQSGAWNGRPGLRRLLDLVRAGKVEAVGVWKLDRFGRSALDVLANIRALTDAGVRFVAAVSQGLDIKADGDAMSRLMLTMLAAFAEFERDLIRERTHLGLERARRNGKRLGRPKARGLLPQDVRDMRAAGKSWSTIAKELELHRRRRAGLRAAEDKTENTAPVAAKKGKAK